MWEMVQVYLFRVEVFLAKVNPATSGRCFLSEMKSMKLRKRAIPKQNMLQFWLNSLILRYVFLFWLFLAQEPCDVEVIVSQMKDFGSRMIKVCEIRHSALK